MDTYIYHGPVYKFDTCIEQNWEAQTWAPTKKKALSNLRYQYKRDNELLPSAKISLLEEYLEEKGE